MNKRPLVILPVLALSIGAAFSTTATADDETDRDSAYAQSVVERARGGDASAQYQTGLLHQRGEGVPRADLVAVAWYRRAAEQNHAQAQHNLGVMYERGDVVTRDVAAALGWYVKAAEQGQAESQYNAGRIYEFGDTRAAEAAGATPSVGSPGQPASLDTAAGGAGPADDIGAFPDAVRARQWYLLAAEQGFEPAIRALRRITATMPEWALAESDRLASEWRVARGG